MTTPEAITASVGIVTIAASAFGVLWMFKRPKSPPLRCQMNDDTRQLIHDTAECQQETARHLDRLVSIQARNGEQISLLTLAVRNHDENVKERQQAILSALNK